MIEFNPELLKNLYRPASDSHKGQNGRLLIIGGSQLFHAASLWALTVASRIVDMVFYSSVETNNRIVESIKSEFRNGIVVPQSKVESYIREADCILIGPGLMRSEKPVSSIQYRVSSIEEIGKLKDEGEQTYLLTKYLIDHFPGKRIVFDGGSLQMMDVEWLLQMNQTPILTPHQGEFKRLFNTEYSIQNTEYLSELAKKYKCVVLVKGEQDTIVSHDEQAKITGGNPGMTRGGTGDVLAGLVAALYCKNDAFLSAAAGSYINKKAGESLEKKMGIYFNTSDLAAEIPVVMKELL